MGHGPQSAPPLVQSTPIRADPLTVTRDDGLPGYQGPAVWFVPEDTALDPPDPSRRPVRDAGSIRGALPPPTSTGWPPLAPLWGPGLPAQDASSRSAAIMVAKDFNGILPQVQAFPRAVGVRPICAGPQGNVDHRDIAACFPAAGARCGNRAPRHTISRQTLGNRLLFAKGSG